MLENPGFVFGFFWFCFWLFFCGFFFKYTRYARAILKCSKISVSTEATDRSYNKRNSYQAPGKTSPVRAVKSCSGDTERTGQGVLSWASVKAGWGVLDPLTSSGPSHLNDFIILLLLGTGTDRWNVSDLQANLRNINRHRQPLRHLILCCCENYDHCKVMISLHF